MRTYAVGRPAEVHTVRGATGTIRELMQAFGVQVSESTVRMRRMNKGWDWERCLLYPGRKPPLRADNPQPVMRNGEPLTHWDLAREQAEYRFDCSLREILMAMIATGATIDDIKQAINLKLTPQHYEGLKRRFGEIRESLQRPGCSSQPGVG